MLGKAKTLDEAIRTASWQLFEATASLSDHRKVAAQAIMNWIAEILAADEHAIGLKPALDEQQGKALKLLTDVPVPASPSPPPAPTPLPPSEPDEVVVRQSEEKDLNPAKARSVLTEIGEELNKGDDLRLSINWKIVRKRGKA